MTDIVSTPHGAVSRIDPRHRYLIKRNADREYVGSTDDLGIALPSGHALIDTIGEDGLGPGIPRWINIRRAVRMLRKGNGHDRRTRPLVSRSPRPPWLSAPRYPAYAQSPRRYRIDLLVPSYGLCRGIWNASCKRWSVRGEGGMTIDRNALIAAAIDEYDDEPNDCYECGGEGFVSNCVEEWACLDPEYGCDYCTRRCPLCHPAKRDPQLDTVLAEALAAQGISTGTAKTAKPVEGEACEPGPKDAPESSAETCSGKAA